MSDLRQALAELETAKPRYFKDWLKIADPDERDLVLSYVHNPAIPANKLAATLAAAGVPITRETILKTRHDARG